MKMPVPVKVTLVLAILVSFSSCAAVVVGGAAYTYVKGWLAIDYNVTLNHGYQASIKAVKSHGLRIVDRGKDVTIAYVKAKGAKREIWVRLKRKSRRVTRISVRVGVIGDRKAAKLIHKAINGGIIPTRRVLGVPRGASPWPSESRRRQPSIEV
jgi:hypothetical protein